MPPTIPDASFHRRGTRFLLTFLVIALLATACGGKSPEDAGKDDEAEFPEAVETGLEDAGDPVRGGTVAYAIEAETSGGYCLPEAQLAISGITVARAFYDTLTVPDDKGEYVPFLAESVEPNETYDEWTVVIREGIKFHDGTDLDGEVVKNNLDAVRGQYEGRAPLLGLFVYANIDTIELADEMTVKITTKVPWVAFPAYLYGSGRYGIMAQAQLDDPETCDRELIGTGPFKFEEWKVDQVLKGSKNEDYWIEAPDGEPYPYLDAIEFRPITEGAQRVNALQTGDVQAIHTSSSAQTIRLREMQGEGLVNVVESTKFAEIGYAMLNAEKAPLDDLRIRQALQIGFDRDYLIDTLGEGVPDKADGPFAPGNMGHLKDPGWPKYDAEKAKKLIAEYKEEKNLDKVEMSLSTPPDPDTLEICERIQSEAKELGLDIKIKQVEQAQLINDAIGGQYDATLFRNHPGGDPDSQYVWWKSDSPVNFGRINDPEIDRLLDAGRSEPDPEARTKIYEDLNRRFAEQGWNLWVSFTKWVVAVDKDVHGIYGPKLPDGSDPMPGLATGHSLMGMWRSDG